MADTNAEQEPWLTRARELADRLSPGEVRVQVAQLGGGDDDEQKLAAALAHLLVAGHRLSTARQTEARERTQQP